MKLILIVILFICFTWGCKTPPPTETEQESPVSLKFGEIAIVKSLNLRVGFRDVLEDSRCPKDMMCFWAGQAVLRLWLLPSNSDTIFMQPTIYGDVNRNDSSRHIAIDTVGFRIKLLQLDPYPVSNIVIRKTDYLALLEISKD